MQAAMAYTGHGSKTICAYWQYFRELVTAHLDEEDMIVGGPGIVAEISIPFSWKVGKDSTAACRTPRAACL